MDVSFHFSTPSHHETTIFTWVVCQKSFNFEVWTYRTELMQVNFLYFYVIIHE